MIQSGVQSGVGELLSVAEVVVWFADDDEGIRLAMAQLLSYSPRIKLSRHFASAEELLQALRSEPAPHLVLLDNRMKGMTGVEAIPLLKQLAPQVHVVIFTNFFDSETRRRALAAGATDFVLKRSSSSQVVNLIKNLFRLDGKLETGVIAALPKKDA